MSLAISLDRRVEAESCCLDRVQVGQSLNWIALQLYKPIHRSSEILIRCLMTPIRPGEGDNASSATLEKVRRVVLLFFAGLIALATLPLYLCGMVIDKLGDCISTKPYTYLPGLAEEKKEPKREYSFFTLNGCLFWGGLPYLFGGCIRPGRERIEKIAELILKQKSDFVLMEELLFESGLELKRKLQNDYAHFYTRIGPNPFKMETGLFIASKYPMSSEPRFIPYPIGSKGGFFCLETPFCWMISAHLEAGSDSARIRKLQLGAITEEIQRLKRETEKPCILLGDLNIKRTGEAGDEYSASGIPENYLDDYALRQPHLSEQSATCTNLLTSHTLGKEKVEPYWEIDDYALIDKESASRFRLETILIKETFSLEKPDEALSDHRGLLYRLSLNS